MTSTKAEKPIVPDTMNRSSIWQNLVKRVFESRYPGGATSMLEYKAKVAKVFAATTVPVSVLNGTPSHARAVFETALDHAQVCVRILACDLDSDAFGPQVANAADRFMRRGGKMDVLIENEPTCWSPLAATLCRWPGSAKVRLVSDEMQARYGWNAMTIDDKAFRFQENRAAMVAVVAGGGDNVASTHHLNEQLDIIGAMSCDLDLAPVIQSTAPRQASLAH